MTKKQQSNKMNTQKRLVAIIVGLIVVAVAVVYLIGYVWLRPASDSEIKTTALDYAKQRCMQREKNTVCDNLVVSSLNKSEDSEGVFWNVQIDSGTQAYASLFVKSQGFSKPSVDEKTFLFAH